MGSNGDEEFQVKTLSLEEIVSFLGVSGCIIKKTCKARYDASKQEKNDRFAGRYIYLEV